MADEKGHQRTPVWDERPESLETFEQKAKLFKMSTKKEDRYLMAPKMLAAMPDDSRQFRNCVTIEDSVLSNPDGSGVDAILLRLRAKGGPRTVQGAAKLLKDLMNNKFLRESFRRAPIWSRLLYTGEICEDKVTTSQTVLDETTHSCFALFFQFEIAP